MAKGSHRPQVGMGCGKMAGSGLVRLRFWTSLQNCGFLFFGVEVTELRLRRNGWVQSQFLKPWSCGVSIKSWGGMSKGETPLVGVTPYRSGKPIVLKADICDYLCMFLMRKNSSSLAQRQRLEQSCPRRMADASWIKFFSKLMRKIEEAKFSRASDHLVKIQLPRRSRLQRSDT